MKIVKPLIAISFCLGIALGFSTTSIAEPKQTQTNYSEELEVNFQLDYIAFLKDKRLRIMEAVAQWKWNHRFPIEDIQREQALESALSAYIDSKPYAHYKPFILQFYRQQVEEAKLFQEELFQEWTAGEVVTFDIDFDLQRDIRPYITKLTYQLSDTLGKLLLEHRGMMEQHGLPRLSLH